MYYPRFHLYDLLQYRIPQTVQDASHSSKTSPKTLAGEADHLDAHYRDARSLYQLTTDALFKLIVEAHHRQLDVVMGDPSNPQHEQIEGDYPLNHALLRIIQGMKVAAHQLEKDSQKEKALKNLTKRICHSPLYGICDATYAYLDTKFRDVDDHLNLKQVCLSAKRAECIKTPLPQSSFFLPVLFAEFKRPNNTTETQVTAHNQCMMYCVSGAKFLASLGIKDFPVYGLRTVRDEVMLCAAWVSETDEVRFTVLNRSVDGNLTLDASYAAT